VVLVVLKKLQLYFDAAFLVSFWFRLNNALLRIVLVQLYSKIRSASATGHLSLPPLHKKDKRSENGLWDTIIFFQMKIIKQTMRTTNLSNQFATASSPSCILPLGSFTREVVPAGPHFQINASKKSKMHYFARMLYVVSIHR
jgi:hypothetical protein